MSHVGSHATGGIAPAAAFSSSVFSSSFGSSPPNSHKPASPFSSTAPVLPPPVFPQATSQPVLSSNALHTDMATRSDGESTASAMPRFPPTPTSRRRAGSGFQPPPVFGTTSAASPCGPGVLAVPGGVLWSNTRVNTAPSSEPARAASVFASSAFQQGSHASDQSSNPVLDSTAAMVARGQTTSKPTPFVHGKNAVVTAAKATVPAKMGSHKKKWNGVFPNSHAQDDSQGVLGRAPAGSGVKREREGDLATESESDGVHSTVVADGVQSSVPVHPQGHLTSRQSAQLLLSVGTGKGKGLESPDGGQLLSTRVFTAFMHKIMENSDAQREAAVEHVEKAFFGVVGSHGNGHFPAVLQQMHAAWNALKKKNSGQGKQCSKIKGEHWVALFAIGCHLNLLTSTICNEGALTDAAGGNDLVKRQQRVILEDKWSAMVNGCTYANLLCDICLQLFSNQRDSHAPYSILPVVLRRVRNTFELACNEGISTVQPNMKSVLLKLHRYVRVPPPKQESGSVVERQRTAAFAAMLGEMMLYRCAPPDSAQFIEAFHQRYADMAAIRCTLYHHCADNLLQEVLTDTVIQQAMELLARAFVIAPNEPRANKQLLFVKLTACGLALGRVPSLDIRNTYDETGLEDLIVAVQSSNLPLFTLAMQNNSELYVRCGIHNVLQVVGKRIALLMVVKYYATCFSDRLPVKDMIDYYRLPYSLSEGCYVWLLPLLVEKRINGVIESGVLVLSGTNPFDDYGKNALIEISSKNTDEEGDV
ncbi:hypothetical protein ERJ75_001523500 [Trypanosoma vivax]|uniref:Uncharacterized protein n=1 Tax=Trypanosoma vivax (strain Y486) TaxID=1055687 RepID=G0UBA4_TRYVY|nr:hypothetical protein TRVL_03186 [Trypanosoma vivax]KAH8606325.1 hypothetical protein ERJ75_001523500 [Trypanosoma vivax]CCC53091.1 conserved hypothetical protein [Trypanosoma vivax Y486]